MLKLTHHTEILPSQHPVFGPGRPAAAAAAIAELAEAEGLLTGWSDYDSPRITRRYKEAVTARAHYPDYGDTFTHH